MTRMSATLVAKMQAWAEAQAKAQAIAVEIEREMRELGGKVEIPTQHGKVITRFSGRGSYEWEKIAVDVLGDRYEDFVDSHATPNTDWEAVAREVAISEKALQAAIERHTTYEPPRMNEDLLKQQVSKKDLAAAKKRFYKPPKNPKFVLELKHL